MIALEIKIDFGRTVGKIKAMHAMGQPPFSTTSDGSENAVMISNISGEEKTVKTNLDGSYRIYAIDEGHFLTEVPLNASEFVIKNNQVALVKNR